MGVRALPGLSRRMCEHVTFSPLPNRSHGLRWTPVPYLKKLTVRTSMLAGLGLLVITGNLLADEPAKKEEPKAKPTVAPLFGDPVRGCRSPLAKICVQFADFA